jgi:alkanesulfonate monooxygenase SsuD/methylene tetrahydromethanopterin reductase-like flavin-dependent oxidoreductase (luciferase family)
VFLAAASQRTTRIRLGHGVMLVLPPYNHPVRCAERIATLDLISDGRLDVGTGESATMLEMDSFSVRPADKRAMWTEAVEQIADMLVMEPYPGFDGQWFSMPVRNVVPKPYQRPHPPMWVACTNPDTIHFAARNGLGALAFAFTNPENAKTWVDEYYRILAEECVPITHVVNPNIAFVTPFSVHEDEDEAVRRGMDGFRFFQYALLRYAAGSPVRPGRTDLWEDYQERLRTTTDPDFFTANGGIGTPSQVRETLRAYADAGVDQMIFIQQSGRNEHEDICDALELFASDVMPEFKAEEPARRAAKAQRLAPDIEAAMARKQRRAEVADADIPDVLSVIEGYQAHMAAKQRES